MKRDRAALLKEILTINELNYKDVCDMTGKTENTVFKWFSGRLAVPDIAILQIKTALSRAHMSIPRDLMRETSCVLYSAVKWAGNNRTENSQTTLVGEKKQDRTELPFYIFGGERMRRSQIAKLSQLSYRTVYYRLSGIKPETDVTAIINRKRWER